MSLSNFKKGFIRDEKHLEFIRSLPCIITGLYGVHAAHIRLGTDGGMGAKPSDKYVIPLFYLEHSKQHRIGEKTYWGNRLAAVIRLAESLYENTGNKEVCLKLIEKFRISYFLY